MRMFEYERDGKKFISPVFVIDNALPEDLLEAQLYALGASQLMKSEKEIIVMHIYVTDNSASVKERRFGSSEIDSAKSKFQDRAKKLKEETTSEYVDAITNFILGASDRSFLTPGDFQNG